MTTGGAGRSASQKNPADGRGWEVLAPVLTGSALRRRRRAWRNSITYNGEDRAAPPISASHLPSERRHVNAEAKAEFDRAPVLDPKR